MAEAAQSTKSINLFHSSLLSFFNFTSTLLFSSMKAGRPNSTKRKQFKNCWSEVGVRQRSLRLITHNKQENKGCLYFSLSSTNQLQSIPASFVLAELMELGWLVACLSSKRRRTPAALFMKKRKEEKRRQPFPFISSAINRHWMVDDWNEMMGLPRRVTPWCPTPWNQLSPLPLFFISFQFIQKERGAQGEIDFTSFSLNGFVWLNSINLLFCFVRFLLAEPGAAPPAITHQKKESKKQINSIHQTAPLQASFISFILLTGRGRLPSTNQNKPFFPFGREEWNCFWFCCWARPLHPPFKFNWFIWFRQFPSSINKSYWPWM